MKLPSIRKVSLDRLQTLKSRVSINKWKNKGKKPEPREPEKPIEPGQIFKTPKPKNPLTSNNNNNNIGNQ